MQHQPKHYKWISFFAVLLVALSIVTPVLADYLGPNRTVTQTVSVCKVYLYECREGPVGHWKDHKVEDWLCSNESKPWEAYDSSGACHAGNNNHKHWEQEEKTETVTTTYPAATISGSIQNCTVQNGWCVTSPQLSLSANEPVSGYNILLIEGTLNGTSFACQAGETSCSVPLNEGDNNFNYWALSSWGDSSAMGNSTARVDTIAPNVGVDISGASGTNGWYVSPVTVTATGSDPTPGSGVASDLLTTDNATWQPSLVFNEGVHDIAVRVIDNAGHVSDATTTLSVDTTTPSINVSVTGTTGNNGWYKSIVQVSAVADDATSKVGTFQVSIDGAAYQAYTNTMQIPLNDGHHTIRFKAVDKAGNPTETPIQDFYIDTLAPLVDLPRSWQVEKNVIYTAQENLSGLAALRVVIEDEDERYAKVTWDEPVSGTTFSDNIHWNGVFKDKTVAPPGTYLVWVKASDVAGNERFQLGKVIVPEPNYVWILPQANAVPATEEAVAPPAPPAELLEGAAAPSLITPPTTDFGGGATQPGEATKQFLLLTSGTAGASAATSSSGILWGAAAAAAIGAATAYALDATRKRKEAEEVQAAQARAQAGGHAGQHLTKEEKKEQKAKQAEAHDQKVKDREESQSWENPAKEKALLKEQAERDQAYQQQQAMQQAAANAAMDKRVAVKYDAQEQAKWDAQEAMRQTVMDRRVAAKYDAQEQAKWEAKQEAAKMSQAAARNAGMLANLPGYFNSEKQAPKEKSWWERTQEGFKKASDKAWLWADQHQAAIALGIGVTFGIAAIILSGGIAAPAVAAAWVAGAALAAAGTATYGTLVLNNHFGREWHENLVGNVLLSGLSAAAISGAWFLFQAATTAAGPFCASHRAICGRVEPIFNAMDWVEEAWLTTKMGYQTWRGDEAGAEATALELQMEHMDGGMPGNSVAKELGEKLGEETLEEVAKHGDEALSLVMLYGGDAAQIITKYGDDGIAVLMKYGDDAIDLIQDHGLRAVKVLQAVDPVYAEDLLEVLDDDVLDYAIQQGPDAVDALSRWSTKDLSEHGMELALRAKKDAKVLADVKKLVSLGPIDPKHLTEEQQALINAIAENCTQYSDEGQVVLGKWVDISSGFVKRAQDTGSVHYNPHPDMWETLGKLGAEKQDDVAWLINKQVVQTGIDKGLPFEYTFNGIPAKDIAKEGKAVEAIFSGKTDAEIMKILKSDYVPIRMKELRELQNAGYKLTFDEATNSYILILP